MTDYGYKICNVKACLGDLIILFSTLHTLTFLPSLYPSLA